MVAPLAIAGVGIAVGSQIAAWLGRKSAAEKKAAALRNNALTQLGSSLSALGARGREEMAAARQQKRLGRRASAVLESRALAQGASSGTGSVDAVQDVAMGEAEFIGSVDAQLAATNADLLRRKKATFENFFAAQEAAKAGVGGIENDFLDFANTALSAINTFDALNS